MPSSPSVDPTPRYPEYPAEWLPTVEEIEAAYRTCRRCGVTIPRLWRHYQPTCRCVWDHADREIRDPDPACPSCQGCGFAPCLPQDCSVMRVSGVCSVCVEPAFYLVAAGAGRIEDSERHFDAKHDEHHKAVPGAGPLVKVVGDYLEREVPGA